MAGKQSAMGVPCLPDPQPRACDSVGSSAAANSTPCHRPPDADKHVGTARVRMNNGQQRREEHAADAP